MPDPKKHDPPANPRRSAESIVTVAVPARDRNEAIQTLSSIASGSLTGTGITFRTDIEAIRNHYESQVRSMRLELSSKRAQGMSEAEIRSWSIAERNRIVNEMRVRQGRVSKVVLDARDYYKYGPGARTEQNLANRARNSLKFKASGLSLDTYLVERAMSPNSGITEAVIRSGKYLKNGGKILVPLGIGMSVVNVVNAPKGERLLVAGEEGSSWVGGAVASEAVVAAMIVLAPETGGLSLLGIGLIAGVGGGALSGWGFHRLFFTSHPHAQASVQQTGSLPATMVQPGLPPSPIPRWRVK